MFVYDQLKHPDKRLRHLVVILMLGLGILVLRLWWLQVYLASDYVQQHERQAVRTVRVPALRGVITDRNGHVLADNEPAFNVSIYLEELRDDIARAYQVELAKVREESNSLVRAIEMQRGRPLTRKERAAFRISKEVIEQVKKKARVLTVSNLVARVSEITGVNLEFNEARFERHYQAMRPLPFVILAEAGPIVVARISENGTQLKGVDLELQPKRIYPHKQFAAHVLGHLQKVQESLEGEVAFFNYPMWVYRGVVGIEAGFDSVLRGRSGVKHVILNSLGYKHEECMIEEPIPGSRVGLTLDFEIQSVAEAALRKLGSRVRGAIVVLDCQTGEILALVSSPAFDPNLFVRGIPKDEWNELNDPELRPMLNRATQNMYPPGSVFKIVTALAILEAGIDPNQKIYNPPSPLNPRRGHIRIGRRIIHDTAPPGEYDFRRGFIKSSNTYFITNGLKVGITSIINMARRLGFGEIVGLPTRQETAGVIPSMERVRSGWSDGDTANVCIGQGPVAVTPLQVAVMTAAIANGGKVLQPSLVRQVGSTKFNQQPTRALIRRFLNVKPSTLQAVVEAMAADVEDPESTAYAAFHPGGKFALQRFRVGGKTGTAEVEDARGNVVDHVTWFTSFGPIETPKYVVVVMVESGGSGGGTCAPIARDIYVALEQVDGRRKDRQFYD